jgi:AraC family transcriptional regulator
VAGLWRTTSTTEWHGRQSSQKLQSASAYNDDVMKTITRENYARRIERVIEFLFDHLDTDIDLHRLAEEAYLSPYHFHRVFHSMMGETVADTIKRLRLHRAAIKLISSNTEIKTIGNEAGYRNISSFTRAFGDAYGISPAAYRAKQVRFTRADALRAHLIAQSRNIPQELAMKNISIQHRDAIRVAALEHRGDYNAIGASFEKLYIWAAGKNIPAQTARSFGIYYDDPAAVEKDQLRSDACFEVDANFVAQDGVRITHTPGGRCAIYLHTGPYSDLHHAYQWLYGVWLPESGEEPADAPPFEEYLNDPRQVAPHELQTAICLPLKAR